MHALLLLTVAGTCLAAPAPTSPAAPQPAASLPAPTRPIVGAIRWDAWFGSKGGPGLAVERSLGPKRYHYRLPFFARVLSDNKVEIPGYTQAIVDKEIAYASGAGLDYWAFVTYEPTSPMSEALDLYLKSKHRADINFCMICGPNSLGTAANHRQRYQRLLHLMAEPTYQRVLGGRPVLFVGFITDAWMKAWGGVKGARSLFDDFRADARAAGVGDPYIVIMDFDPAKAHRYADEFGADAISTYAAAGDGGHASPYSALAAAAHAWWDKALALGAHVVPTVMSGWDRRPRIEHPVPWETWQKPGVGMDRYYHPPTPAQLAAHLDDALRWTMAHPKTCPARLVLIYAWNENDEGGWLVPTLSGGTARLDAIRPVLRPGPAAAH